MSSIRYLLGVCILILLPFSGFSQELELPRLGTFQIEKSSIPEMKDIWKQSDYENTLQKLKLPKVNSKNYRTPVNMANVVAGIENSKQAAKSQNLMDNIRISSYGSSQKEDKKGSFKLKNSIHTELRPNTPFSTCIHGSTQRYCTICAPRTGFGNFGFGTFGHPATRSFYYP